MAPMPSRLEDLAIQLGTTGGTPRFWPPDPLLPDTEYVRGVPPPPGHIWWRCATQLALGQEGCEEARVPPFQLRRRFKSPGARPRPKGTDICIGEVGPPHHWVLLVMFHLPRVSSASPSRIGGRCYLPRGNMKRRWTRWATGSPRVRRRSRPSCQRSGWSMCPCTRRRRAWPSKGVRGEAGSSRWRYPSMC